MALPERFKDELLARVGLADLIGKRVRLTRKGREHQGLCPFHNEKTPSFTVNEEKGFYHCFGCGAHGDAISFVMNTEGLGFVEAVESLAGLAGLEVPRASPAERQREEKRQSLFDVVEAAAVWFEKQLPAPAGREAKSYLERRGVTPDAVRRFRLGFAPDFRTALLSAMQEQGIAVDRLLEAGLVIKPEDGRPAYDRFRGRVIFPIADRRGRVIAFGGRILGDGEPKYLNSPETGLFHKGQVLYGLAQALQAARESGELIVTEGYMDVIALAMAGFPAAVAPLGTALTEEQIGALWKIVDEPVLAFDGDNAGQRAAARAAERVLPMLLPGKSLRFAFLPKGEDPDSLIKADGPAAMRGVLEAARPLIEVVWDTEVAQGRTDTPERRAALRAGLRQRISAIADATVQAAYRDEVDRRFDAAFSFRRQAFAARGNGRLPFAGASQKSNRHLAAGNVTLRRRRQQVILATLLHHPSLMDGFGEQVAGLEFDGDLDKLRQALHEAFSAAPSLDSEGLRRQLTEVGFADAISALRDEGILAHASFAREAAEIDAARRGLRHMLDLASQVRRRDEVRAQGRDAADVASVEGEARFLAVREEVERSEHDIADIDRLDPAFKPAVAGE